MDAFRRDLQAALSDNLKTSVKNIRNICEQHARFLEGAAGVCVTGSDVTELMACAMEFHNSGLTHCSILILEYQVDNLPDSSVSAFSEACVQLFRSVNSDTVRCTVNEVIKLSHAATKYACYTGTSRGMIRVLQRLLSLMSPRTGCLSAIHADFLQACISAKMYSVALHFLSDTDIVEISPKVSPISTADFLRYFHYAGIIYTTMKRYSDALDCFDQVLSTPASALSAIAIASFRKASLVSLVERNDTYTVPKSASHVVNRIDSQGGEHSCKVYAGIAKLFVGETTGGAEGLAAYIKEHATDLSEHGNQGLAELVVEAYPVRQMLRVSRTYATISMQGLSRAMGSPYSGSPALTEKCLLSMIERGKVCATIDKQQDMITFFSDPLEQSGSHAELALALSKHLENAIGTHNDFRQMHADVLAKRTFVSRAISNLQSNTSGSSVMAGMADGYGEVYLE